VVQSSSIVLNGYSKNSSEPQYFDVHLFREVEDLEKEFPEDAEVSAFVAVVIDT
jgi:transposase